MPRRIRVRSRASRVVRVNAARGKQETRHLNPSVTHFRVRQIENESQRQHKQRPTDTLSSDQLGIGAMDNNKDGPNVPAIFTSPPPIKDSLVTETSISQDETIQECLPFMAGETSRSIFDYNVHGLPSLDREKHIEYLHGCLGALPAGFVGFDAARPWLVYWTLTGLSILGESVDQYRSR